MSHNARGDLCLHGLYMLLHDDTLCPSMRQSDKEKKKHLDSFPGQTAQCPVYRRQFLLETVK